MTKESSLACLPDPPELTPSNLSASAFGWYAFLVSPFLPGKGHASDRQTLGSQWDVGCGMWEGDSSSRVSGSGYPTEALGYWRHHMVLCRTTVAEGLKNAEGQKP